MRLNKKVIGTLLGIAGILAVTAVTTNEIQVSEKELGVSEAANTSLEDEAVAGVTAALNAYQKNAAEQAVTKVSVEKEDIEVVAASLEGDSQDAGVMNEEDAKTSDTEASDEKAADNNSTESESKEAQPELTKEEEKWQDYLMADVEQSLNVRKKANEDAEIVGKLYKGDRAKILKGGDEWIKIESGNVKGYVKTSYCVTGTKALKYAKKNCDTIATVNTDGLRLRSKQSTEKGKVITAVASGTKLKVKTKEKTKDGWVAVVYNNDLCYVSEDYVDVSLKTGKAVTLEEEAAKKAAEEAAKKAAAEAEAAKNAAANSGAATTQGSAVSASADDVTLLAAIIQCEAGGCSYAGQLAVGAVVMNRVKSSSFPNTI